MQRAPQVARNAVQSERGRDAGFLRDFEIDFSHSEIRAHDVVFGAVIAQAEVDIIKMRCVRIPDVDGI